MTRDRIFLYVAALAVALGVWVALVPRLRRPGRTTVSTAPTASLAPPIAEPESILGPPRKAPTLRHGDVEMHGHARDIGGGPIANVTVTLTRPLERGGGFVVQTDASGDFVAWVDAGELVVGAVADGYAPVEELGSAPGPRIQLVLTPESVLEGRVVEAGTAIPVAGVFVSVGHDPATTPGKALTDAEGHFRTRQTPTDADGRFVLDHVVGGDGKLYARGTGVHEALDVIMEPITVPPGGTLDLPQRSFLPYDPGAVP